MVPDFISNAGGITIAVVDILGGTAENVFRLLDTLLSSLTLDILADAKKEGVNPTRLSKMRTREKILRERTSRKSVSFEEFYRAVANPVQPLMCPAERNRARSASRGRKRLRGESRR